MKQRRTFRARKEQDMSGWLKCKIFKGMFSDEKAVLISSLEGREISCFVPKELVQGGEDAVGKVQVKIRRKNNRVWAILPTETSTMVAVKDADLVLQ
jgi:hypothetical protein